MQLILLELNEVNFEHVSFYAARGETPNIKQLIDAHGIVETTSEREYEKLEPWIQWVTAHTGKTYEEHQVFRLGDIVQHDLAQIWEHLEKQGLRIGAVSPMNASNRTSDAAFFIPDPWTPTTVTGGALTKRLYAAIAQAVNDNAQALISLSSAAWLFAGLLRYSRPRNYGQYARLGSTLRNKPWRKAMLLDLLFADLFVRETQRTRPDFASLFLNGAAHIQHHYMFNSRAYSGPLKNPSWYVSPNDDPVGEVYRLYDQIVGQVRAAFPQARLLIATGLRQDPYGEVTFYWRLKDHATFLKKLGIRFSDVEPRMSRDFLVRCSSTAEAINAEQILASVKSTDGTPLFDVDNRGVDLFVILTWPNDIDREFEYTVPGRPNARLFEDVAFVAVKNGHHNGVGYVIDTGATKSAARFPLKDLPHRICAAFGVEWNPSAV